MVNEFYFGVIDSDYDCQNVNYEPGRKNRVFQSVQNVHYGISCYFMWRAILSFIITEKHSATILSS